MTKSNIKFRPLKPSDFYEIEAQPRHQRLLTWLRANPLSIRHMTEDPFSYTMEVDGRAVATGGTTLDNEIWALNGWGYATHSPAVYPVLQGHDRATRAVLGRH
jgi:hypothetical protein